MRTPPISTLFPYTTLFRSWRSDKRRAAHTRPAHPRGGPSCQGLCGAVVGARRWPVVVLVARLRPARGGGVGGSSALRSEEHTSELQSHSDLVCRLLLEKKK